MFFFASFYIGSLVGLLADKDERPIDRARKFNHVATNERRYRYRVIAERGLKSRITLWITRQEEM